jgi:hypothetical protein
VHKETLAGRAEISAAKTEAVSVTEVELAVEEALLITAEFRVVTAQELVIEVQPARAQALALVTVRVAETREQPGIALVIAACPVDQDGAHLAVPAVSTGRVHDPVAVAVLPAWAVVAAALAVAVEVALVAAVAAAAVAAGAVAEGGNEIMKRNKTTKTIFFAAALISLSFVLLLANASITTAQNAAKGRTFATPQAATEALVDAAEKFDEAALTEILGPDSYDIIHTGESARDREVLAEFAALARLKTNITTQPRNPRRAFLAIGEDDWPFPVPIVKAGSTWSFDTKAGRQEIFYRRVGANELNAIQICRGYVEAQHDYALVKRGTSGVNQYAQRIISTPGQQDGLAWQNSDGSWGGPIGEKVAAAIARGYSSRTEPFHGYYFRVLKGQGPAAPLGEMDFLVKDVMIGGFALIAFPAQYRLTGVQTFMVSHDGVVYQKDLGPKTAELAAQIDRFDPDRSWTPVLEQ